MDTTDRPAVRPVDPSALEELRSLGLSLARLGRPATAFQGVLQHPGDPEAYQAMAAKVQLAMYLLHFVREWLREQQPELLGEALPRWLCPKCGHPVDAQVEK
ncbi:hypothetical protein [Acrocarpospora sp. B8E8]|uniref:hypothetical protein n=1 Tax=Acrocarpospora sp. B8E8 TaxID=3153572 RepID=UPI00325EE8FD